MKNNLVANQRFGKLTIIDHAGTRPIQGQIYNCKCDCGNSFIGIGSKMLNGNIRSCGCLRYTKEPNLETKINIIFSDYKRNAHKRKYAFELGRDEFKDIIFRNCRLCGSPPSLIGGKRRSMIRNGVDRLNNSKGYVKGNCVSCCSKCNIMKGTLDIYTFLNQVKLIEQQAIRIFDENSESIKELIAEQLLAQAVKNDNQTEK